MNIPVTKNFVEPPNHHESIVVDYLGKSIERINESGDTRISTFGNRKTVENLQNDAEVLGALAVSDIPVLSTGEIVRHTRLPSLQVNKSVTQLNKSIAYEGLVSATEGQRIQSGKNSERSVSKDHLFAVSSRWYSPEERQYLTGLYNRQAQKEKTQTKLRKLQEIRQAARQELTDKEQVVLDKVSAATDNLDMPAFVGILDGENSRIYRRNPNEDPEIIYAARQDASDERLEERVKETMAALKKMVHLKVGDVLSMSDIEEYIHKTNGSHITELTSNVKKRITYYRPNKGQKSHPAIAADLTANVPGRPGTRGSSGIRKTSDFTVVEL